MNNYQYFNVLTLCLTLLLTSFNAWGMEKKAFTKLLIADSDHAYTVVTEGRESVPYLNSIAECIQKNCSLSRKVSPGVRKKFEDVLAHRIEYEYDYQSPLVYTSLGSGSLFQDLAIITKLRAKGFKKISVQLIDPQYKNPCQFVKEGLQQFSSFFSDPHDKIIVTPFSSTQEYLSAIENEKRQKSHVITTIDTYVSYPQMEVLSDSIPIFKDAKQLAENGLHKNGILASLVGGTVSPMIGSKPSFSACIRKR